LICLPEDGETSIEEGDAPTTICLPEDGEMSVRVWDRETSARVWDGETSVRVWNREMSIEEGGRPTNRHTLTPVPGRNVSKSQTGRAIRRVRLSVTAKKLNKHL